MKENKKIIKQFKKRNTRKAKSDFNWIIKITLIGFMISLTFSVITEILMTELALVFSFVIIFFFLILGIIADMLGVAITSTDIKPFHAMSAKKIRGSKTAIKMIKNQAKYASFLNDVIGDISGIITGTLSIAISIKIANYYNLDIFFITIIITSTLAALTIGGKALGKEIAVSKGIPLIFNFSRAISYIKKEK